MLGTYQNVQPYPSDLPLLGPGTHKQKRGEAASGSAVSLRGVQGLGCTSSSAVHIKSQKIVFHSRYLWLTPETDLQTKATNGHSQGLSEM